MDLKTRRNLITAVCVSVITIAAHAANPSRTAKIEDTSGVKTDVTDLQCSFTNSEHFSGAGDCVSITTSGYEVAIPASRLISITSSGDKVDVMYRWRGQQRTISGTLDATFSGKSDFGDFKLSSLKLRQLSFSNAPPAEKTEQQYRTPVSASVGLTNGTTIAFSDLQRHDSYYSSVGYLIGGSMRYNHYTCFSFMRGESLATLEFAVIKKLEFGADAVVTVTLTNGKTTSGKLSTESGAGVDGWTGETEQGLVFLAPSMVQVVKFGGIKELEAPFEKKAKLLFPAFTRKLVGQNSIQVRNPNDFAVMVGLRSAKKGRNFVVPANGIKTVSISNGKFDIYFVYSSKPDALFQGDSFTLNDNGVEIQIVKVVNGNYNIRQVK